MLCSFLMNVDQLFKFEFNHFWNEFSRCWRRKINTKTQLPRSAGRLVSRRLPKELGKKPPPMRTGNIRKWPERSKPTAPSTSCPPIAGRCLKSYCKMWILTGRSAQHSCKRRWNITSAGGSQTLKTVGLEWKLKRRHSSTLEELSSPLYKCSTS